MIKHEAKITTRLRRYIEESGIHIGSAAIEVKVSLTKSLPFNAVQPHQLQALENARSTFVWKIADDSRGVKPFDMFVLQNAAAFVAVAWLAPRKKVIVYLIPVRDWKSLSEASGRKSLTEDVLLKSGKRYLTCVLPTKPPLQAPS